MHPVPVSAIPGVPDTETGRLLLGHDWAATPLGPMDIWPQSLRLAVSVCLNSRFPMFVWWGDSLVNIYNDAYIPVLGKRHPDAFGGPARHIWSDIWDVLGPQVDAVMLRGQPTWNERVLLLMERNNFEEETYFTWSYSPVHRADGSIGGLFCACTEETSRVVAERERDRLMLQAQDAARTLQTWFDNAPGYIALLRGPDFVIEMANMAYSELIGHRPVIGLPVFEALPELRSQGFEELLRRVWRTKQPFVGRAVRALMQKRPGAPLEEIYTDFVYQPVVDARGTVIGIFAQGSEVTEQVQAVQALREADRRKDEFLATLAHELRNPLAPIRQSVALARLTPDAEKRRWALEVIDRQAQHMSLLLDDLLEVSRISRGRVNLRMQRVTVQEVVAHALETARPLLEGRRHALSVQQPDTPVAIDADPVRLAQVVSNLLSNAAKYTDEGGRIELRVRAAVDRVRIIVRDNGIGLAPDSLQQVFEMFSQVEAALHRSQGGLGIGLALSKALVQLHGGTIEAASAGLGQGAQFTVDLPLPAPPQQVPSQDS